MSTSPLPPPARPSRAHGDRRHPRTVESCSQTSPTCSRRTSTSSLPSSRSTTARPSPWPRLTSACVLAASDTTVVGQTRLPARSSTLLPTPSTTSRRSPLVVCIDFRHSRAEISLFHQSNADNHSSLRSDHSLELPSSHVGMEDWPGHCLR